MAISTFQLVLFLAYLGVKIVLYTIKAVKKHQARRNEEELELMENQLASRKAKPRSIPSITTDAAATNAAAAAADAATDANINAAAAVAFAQTQACARRGCASPFPHGYTSGNKTVIALKL